MRGGVGSLTGSGVGIRTGSGVGIRTGSGVGTLGGSGVGALTGSGVGTLGGVGSLFTGGGGGGGNVKVILTLDVLWFSITSYVLSVFSRFSTQQAPPILLLLEIICE